MVTLHWTGFILVAATANAFTLRSWADATSLAADTVSKLTLPEKIGLVTGVGMYGGRCVGNTLLVNSSTVKIPSICFQDGPAGMRLVKNVTGFPTGINTASTFSKRLMRARGVALGEEWRGKGAHVFLGPAMDISRNPKGGRNWESFGPDPFLNGEGAYETIIGVQSAGVQACAKHFLANNQEHWRYGLTANVDDRTLHEIYMYPFLRSVEADVSSVMCAYNRVNGTSSCHNANLIGDNGMMRKAGFKGYTVSDWGATHDTTEENANNGLDMEMPGSYILIGGGLYGNGLTNAVNDGKVTLATLNKMVSRVLIPYYRLGQDSGFPATNFDANKPDNSGSLNLRVDVRSAAHTALAREIAAASSVLLKNNRTTTTRGLPLNKATQKTLAIIGLDANIPKLDCDDLNKCNTGTMSIGWGSGSNNLQYIVPPNAAIKSFIGTAATITESLVQDTGAAVTAARGKDVAIVFANADSGELGFYDVVEGNMGDRNDLNLWWKGGSLVEAVAGVNANTIVVIHSVGPVSFSWSNHPNISAIIYAGAPGEQTGPGLVDVLWGAVNPSGRLPFSIADAESSYGTEIVYNSGGFPELAYTEKLLIDYRYMDANGIVPRFAFGFGLSYTTFAYSALSITTSGTTKSVAFTVQNSGAVAGTEIAQLYLGYPAAAGEPKMVLRGFEEVGPLAVGASKTVTLLIPVREQSVWNTPSQQYVKPTGTFTVYVGASIKDIRLTGTF